MSDKDEKSHEEIQEEAYARALHREREGYLLRKLDDRVKAVDAELKRLGASRASEERAESAPQETAAESRPRRTASARGGKAD